MEDMHNVPHDNGEKNGGKKDADEDDVEGEDDE